MSRARALFPRCPRYRRFGFAATAKKTIRTAAGGRFSKEFSASGHRLFKDSTEKPPAL
ncbi:MAG: hypothetical protein ISN28_11040 [Ectothiorhodospiraceae bacterium AqS1]|nr:hypothetical protein [Ectothiorhodospiraceae bacterium AqS1]